MVGIKHAARRNGRYLASFLGALLVSLVVSLVGVAVLDAQPVSAATCPCTIWPTTASPVNTTSPDASSIEVGVKFRPDTTGFITGVRFYKLATNTGTHIGNLWTSTGTLLASATFSGETASGWQQVNFASAVAVTANTTYVASYFAPNGHYANDQNAFASAGVDNAPLHALSNAVGGGNGVYGYGPASNFPAGSFMSSNYWVDTVFSTTAPPTSTPTRTPLPLTCPCTIWPSTTAPTNTTSPDASSIEIGVKFRADSSGFVTGVRFYKLSSNTGAHTGHLWTSTGTLLASATFSGETASGWQQANFSTPVAIAANTVYVASYFTPTGHYANDQSYFASGGVDRSPLHALSDSAGGGNGVYGYGAASNFPGGSFMASNYWVDTVFSTTAPSTPTALPTSTATPVAPGTATPTAVAAATATPTSVAPATSTPTALPTSTATPVAPATATPTSVAAATATPTAGAAATATPTAGAGGCPCSVWSSATTPSNLNSPDTSALEVGVKFRSDTSGYIWALRFYKLGNNTGTHVGSLWTSTGTLLGSATFTGETASGWQQVTFGSAVAITANTTYVASYHTSTGGYADDQNFFASGVDNAPLHALSDAAGGGNGVYAYGASTTFPNNSFSASNYWVDVVFNTIPPPPPGPTTISGVSASSVGTTTTSIVWTTNNPASSQVQYGPTATYGSTTALDSTLVTSHSQSLSGLNAGATYHYRVQSRDSGGILVSSADGTFTTVAVGATGQWSAVMNWPLVAVHSTLLDTGKVLMWDAWETGGTPSARLWDPVSKAFTSVPDLLSQIFCAAQVQMADGRIMVVGGHNGGENGITAATIFDPSTSTWSAGAPMNYPRWYPMATELGDGRVVALGGNITPGVFADTPEVYDPASNSWSTINVNTADADEENYPLGFVLPNGNLFVIGPDQGNTRILNVNAQTWTTATAGTSPVIFGSAIQYRPGQFLYTGGSHATNSETTAATIDMTQATPTWHTIAPMGFARSFHSLVSLPDGNVLVVGGGPTNQQTDTVPGPLQPELWNPTTGTWTTLAAMQTPRMYHSTALLLADGTVMVAGGGKLAPAIDEPNAEIFSPPYLSKGARPTIISAPATATIGTSLTIQTPDAASIASVALISLGADTHNYDMSQRFVPLMFTAAASSLSVQMPTSVNLAPPGNYMLFLVNTSGVPSIAPTISVQPATPSGPPTISNVASTGIGGYSATATWTTDRIATSLVDYGITIAYGHSTAVNPVHSTNHSMQMLNLSANTSYHYRVRSTDTFGNQAISGDFTFTTASAPTCPCTIWTASAAPTTPVGNDGQGIEVGLKFITEHDGFINGVRFYKGSGNAGVHTGHLWAPDGTLLASATFSGETATGWQQVNFSSPVAVTGGTVYVVSYLSASGNYSATAGAFSTAGVDHSPLHALSNSAAGGNGVYTYTSTARLPDQTFEAANYWVDAVYTLTGTGASMAPAVASQDGGTSVEDVAGPSGSSELSWKRTFIPPSTQGAAMQLIALGLVKPHGMEHTISFWCPLGTTSPDLASVTWSPEGQAPPQSAAVGQGPDAARIPSASVSVPSASAVGGGSLSIANDDGIENGPAGVLALTLGLLLLLCLGLTRRRDLQQRMEPLGT